MLTIEYDDIGTIARFDDQWGDKFRVEVQGEDTVMMECLSEDDEALCGVLDAPRVDALIALLQRWRATGQLRPEGEGA